MGFGLLLGICALLCLSGSALAEEPGTDFAVVFMDNLLPNVDSLHLEVFLTPYFPETQVTIEMPNKNYKEVFNLMPNYPLNVELPQDAEIVQSTRSSNTVHITSNRPISVVATNGKSYKTSVTVLSPMDLWGRDYYVATPEIGPEDSLKQVAVVNCPQPNVVSILLSRTVVFENVKYLAGEFLNLTLSPWEAVQLQSNESLTGSHVLSQEPVALFAGRTCAEMHGNCQVCLQLPPVSDWGSTFVSPPLPYQKVSSKVYILAATETQVSIVNGYNVTSVVVTPAMGEEIHFDSMMPLLISSPGKILVLLYFGQGLHEPYEGFLSRLAPKESTCTSYSIVWVPGFENKLVVVARADNYNGMQLNHNLYPELVWEAIPGTNLVYTFWPILSRSYNFIYNPGHFFGIATIGTAEKNSYGAHGICLDKVYQLCEFECSYELQCPNPCKPPEILNCMVWGTTHLKTFSGTHYFKSGNCPSQLLAVQFHPTIGSFNLERWYDREFTVLLVVWRYILEIPAAGPWTVRVNGELKYMPVFLENGQINITHFGLYTFVKTSFGLKVVIGDNDGFVHVQMPRIYSDYMYGLCINPIECFEAIWSTQGTYLNCNAGSLISPTPCENIDRDAMSCSHLLGSEIFQGCHPILDPIPFIESCEFEACEKGSICLGLAAYAQACVIKNVNLTDWRSLAGCDAVQCPPQSHYESCPSSCPATCLETDCPTESCFESCVCDGDLQLSPMGTCVLPNECGCNYEGKYYSPGAKFLINNCYKQCHCNGNKLECQETQGCDPDQICELKNGSLTCVPYLSCYIFGNSHIRFDNQVMSNNGSCQSTMVEVCSNDLGLEYFSVRTDHEKDLPHLAAVHIAVYGKNITLFPQPGQIYVDGVFALTPYIMDYRLYVLSFPSSLILYSDFGLLVLAEINGGLYIKVPATYQRGVCGLCSADNVISETSCSVDCQGICPSCQFDEYLHYLSNDMCGMLSDPNGKFRDCLRHVNPVPYVESCINDLCNNRTLCNSIASYVAACQDSGVQVEPWRSPNLCDYTCPPNSFFSMCASVCMTICAFNTPVLCPLGCREGCICNPGYIWSDDGCILPEDCGCYFEDQFLKEGETFYKDGCQVVCTCMHGKVICAKHSCSPGETCQDVGGIPACYPKPLTCWISGHKLHTFNGSTFRVSRECTYTMVTTNCNSSRMTDLALEFQLSRNLFYGNLSTPLNAKLRIHGHTIILKEYNNDIEIDGIPYPLPVELENVVISGENGMDNYVRIEADHGLILFASPSMVWISLPSTYAGNICGLCGNANGNFSDTEGLSSEEFLSSWVSLQGNNSCQASSKFSDSEMSAYNMTTLCDVIVMVDGAFSNCHASISPNESYSTCLNYASENLLPFVCNVIGGYATECEAINATVYPWENATLCDSNENQLLNITPQTIQPMSTNDQEPIAHRTQESGCTYYMEAQYFLPWGSSADLLSPTECYLLLASVDNDTALEPFYIGVEYIIGPDQNAINLMINIYGIQILIMPTVLRRFSFGLGQIFVNREPINLPASLASGNVSMLYDNSNFILGTVFGLLITFGPSGEIFILPPDNYVNHLHGWCAGNKLQFFNEERLCNIKSESKEWSCKNETMHNACSPLLDEAGPFEGCHNISSPLAYYERCRRNFCESGGNQQAVCHVFQEYTQACQEQHAIIQPWRNDTFCTFQCPRGGVTYDICTKPCRMCQGNVCFASHCTEGCTCVGGLLWDGNDCVPPELCKEAGSHETEHMFPPKYLNCDGPSQVNSTCLSCWLDAFSLRTFGDLSIVHSANGTYEILKTCHDSTSPWLRVVLRFQPLPGRLYFFFEKSFIVVNDSLDVWINGERITPPVTVAPNLYLSKMEGVFSVVWPEHMGLSIDQSGQLNIEVREALATKLCGVCTLDGSSQISNELFFLESWMVEDLS